MTEVSAIHWQTRLEPLAPMQWSDLLAEFADGNFYQTHAYGSVSWGRASLTHLVVCDADGVRAIAQVRQIRFGRWFGVAYVRWGPCVQRRSEPWHACAFREALRSLACEFVHRRRWVLRVIPNLFQEDEQASTALQVLQQLGFQKDASAIPYRTIRVDLESPLEEVRKRLDGKWRNQLNAATRNGLEITEGNESSLFGRFVGLYDEMMSRKRFETSVDVREFLRIQEHLAPPEKMRVALAGQSGQLHAGVVTTAVGDTGIYLLGATGQEGLKSKASYLLQWRMIEYLKSVGCRFYDLGGINPEANPGVYHFKSGMGGLEVHQLGRFELGASEARRRLLHWAERWQRALHSWRQNILR
ncbi:lipid II:glycine glycyltransferase FemX [Limisphaera sp. VF-2]|uniref:lipid II:glycine glycyltransferase FemX n=1 Tax=Limisphaera sp. VF-2 TaxID=3400418 RepID=UPI003C1EF33F